MNQNNRKKLVIIPTLFLGLALVLISSVNSSSLLAILGVSVIFCSCLWFYFTPVKKIPISIFNYSAPSGSLNIERILSEFNIFEKGIYLPPKYLENSELSLVFLPKSPTTSLPSEIYNNFDLFSAKKDGILITPPGYLFSLLLQEKASISFLKNNLSHLEVNLKKALIEGLELAEDIEVYVNNNLVRIDVINNLIVDSCKLLDNQPRTHKQVGCLLSSSFACILAKTTGKPIVIQSDNNFSTSKITKIEYLILEE